MTDPIDPDATTDDGRAPVLGEDQAQQPPEVDEEPKKPVDPANRDG